MTGAQRRAAVVVGAGIGGLCAAIGLCRIGWRVTVLERAPRFDPIGAGITLMPNALQALDALGVGAEFRALAPVTLSGGLRTGSGRWLTRWDSTQMQRLLGEPIVAVHRAQLHAMLLAALPPDCVRTGVELTDAAQAGDVDLVVAADGIDSGLRAQRWPEVPPPVYSGLTTWRGISPAPDGLEVGQTLEGGAEFGIVPLADGRVYWFGAAPAPAGVRHPDELAAVLARFGGWHAPISRLVETSENVLHHDIHWLRTPPDSYVRGRVALLGDAAHAMTPHLGQGGCQAVEDAVVLAAALAATPDVDAALDRYDRERRPRTVAIARTAERIGRVNGLTHPVPVAARNALIRLLPGPLAVRSMARTARWTPPTVEV